MVGRDIWGMGGRLGKRAGFRADRTTRCAAFFHSFVLQPGRPRLTEARLHPTRLRRRHTSRIAAHSVAEPDADR